MRDRFPGKTPLLIATFLAVAVSSFAGESTGTNAVKAAPSPVQQNGLKQLEKDLFRPFQGLSPESSLDGVLNPANRPLPQPRMSPAAREREEKRKNWMFMEPEEIMAGPWQEAQKKEDEKIQQEQQGMKLTPTERYLYQLFDQTRKPSSKKAAPKKDDQETTLRDPFGSAFENAQANGQKRDDGRPANQGSSQENKSKAGLFGSSQRDPVTKPKSFFSDWLGNQQSAPTKDEIDAEKARQDSFRQLIGMSPRPSDDSLNPVSGLGDLYPKATTAAPALPSPADVAPKPTVFDVQLGAITGLPKISALEDPTTKALAIPTLPSSAPKVETPKSYFPNTPTFSAPRRSFQ